MELFSEGGVCIYITVEELCGRGRECKGGGGGGMGGWGGGLPCNCFFYLVCVGASESDVSLSARAHFFLPRFLFLAEVASSTAFGIRLRLRASLLLLSLMPEREYPSASVSLVT